MFFCLLLQVFSSKYWSTAYSTYMQCAIEKATQCVFVCNFRILSWYYIFYVFLYICIWNFPALGISWFTTLARVVRCSPHSTVWASPFYSRPVRRSAIAPRSARSLSLSLCRSLFLAMFDGRSTREWNLDVHRSMSRSRRNFCTLLNLILLHFSYSCFYELRTFVMNHWKRPRGQVIGAQTVNSKKCNQMTK